MLVSSKSCPYVPPPFSSDPDDDDDDEEGISGTGLGEEENPVDVDIENISGEDTNDLEDGEFRIGDVEFVVESKLEPDHGESGCKSSGVSRPPAAECRRSGDNVFIDHGGSKCFHGVVQPTFVFNAKPLTNDTEIQGRCNRVDVGAVSGKTGSFGPFNDLIKKGCFGPFNLELRNVDLVTNGTRPPLDVGSGREFDGSFIKRRRVRCISSDRCRGQSSFRSVSTGEGSSPPIINEDCRSPPLPPLPHSPPLDLNSSPRPSESRIDDDIGMDVIKHCWGRVWMSLSIAGVVGMLVLIL
ncbi:hypothetical protein L1887_14016 [Cichorium endivia]|nr:hypothetical protein L1887_14016 [Cichorium endivia]